MSNIHTLAAAASGTGVQTGVEPIYKGNPTGTLFIDFDGATFTAKIESRAEGSDTWITHSTLTEASDPVLEIVITPKMRLNITAFSGTTLTVKIAE